MDTIIHQCNKHEVCHVVGFCIWTLKPEQQNALDHVRAFGQFDDSFYRWFWASVFGLHFWDSIDHFWFW